MQKMSISDAAEHYGVSKEAIHNRIRRGSLECVLEEGVKYVVLDANPHATPRTSKPAPQKANIDDRYYKFLEEQNAKLQQRVEVLEGETRTLREQKEQMLIAERERIELIYKEKDEQLKNILNAISSKFMLEHKDIHMPKVQKEEHVEAELEEEPELEDEQTFSEPISLKKYLKEHAYSKKSRQKVKERFEAIAKIDKRVIVLGDKLYINPEKYDYSDLL